MKLESRMRQSIRRRKGTLIFRSDVAALGSQTQVTHALDALIHNGELLRIARGIYAKAKREKAEEPARPTASLETIICEAAQKLGLELHHTPSRARSNACGKEIIVETNTPRTSRTLIVNGKIIRFQSYQPKRYGIANPPLKIPTVGVDNYVQRLARKHKIKYVFSYMDQWAETVTRLAGDSVRQDRTEDLLIALKRAGKITQQDVARLTVNYLRERKQSV